MIADQSGEKGTAQCLTFLRVAQQHWSAFMFYVLYTETQELCFNGPRQQTWAVMCVPGGKETSRKPCSIK